MDMASIDLTALQLHPASADGRANCTACEVEQNDTLSCEMYLSSYSIIEGMGGTAVA